MTETELEKLYSESYRSVYWTAINLLKRKEDAEDIIQDTYLTAFRMYDSLSDKTKAVAWIKKIAANKCLNVIKAKRTFVAEDEFFENEEAVGEVFLPASLVESEEKRKIIMDIVRKCLSEDAYITVILYYFNNMTTGEISEQLGIPQGTVLSRLDYARKKIKKEVLKYEKDNDDKLFAMGIPFLTLLFEKEAESVPLRPIPPAIKNISASQNITAAAQTAVQGGKNIMIKKLLLGAAALVLAGVTAVAVYKVKFDDKKDTSVRKDETIEETKKGSSGEGQASGAGSDTTSAGTEETIAEQLPAYVATEFTCDPDGGDKEISTERVYSQDGNLLQKTIYRDWDVKEESSNEYDEKGNLIKSWRYSYQSGNSYTENEYGDFGRVRTVSYDPDNNNAIRYVVEYTYDDQGRLIKKEQSNDSGLVYITYTYEYNADGSYTEYSDSDGTSQVAYYDAEDKCLEEYTYRTDDVESGKEFHTVYTYDGDHKVKVEHYEDGVLTRYQIYDYTDSPVDDIWSSSTEYDADGVPFVMYVVEIEFCD